MTVGYCAPCFRASFCGRHFWALPMLRTPRRRPAPRITRSPPLKRFAVLLFFVPARADLPALRFDRLTPLGGAAGTTIDIEIQGVDMEEAKTLLFDHPGLKATFVKERYFRVAIAAD